jgi:hypothetical protein
MAAVIHMSTRRSIAIFSCTIAVIGSGILAFTLAPLGGDGGDSALPELALPPEGGVGEPVLAAAATTAPSPTPVPGRALDSCGPPISRDYLAGNQVLSYYGNPYTELMGILGEMPPAELVARLRAHAATYDSLNGPAGIRPALHIVYGRATTDPGGNKDHLLYIDDQTMNEYIDLACREGMLVFVDLQIGHSDVETEVRKVLPFLEHPNVHLALDPEFAMPPGELPGESVGTMDAAEVNAAQAIVQTYAQERGLGEKMLIVHKFVPEMLTRPELLQMHPGVRLVIDMDGFGPADVKKVKYGWFSGESEYSGIKLFFRQEPDLMSEADVLGLQPAVDVIIYQ